MNDINEIYAPIYREPNRIPFYILIVLITLLIITTLYYIIKKIKTRPIRERTFEEIYSDCIEEITALGTELQERHLYCFKDFLSHTFCENFYAKTHEELIIHKNLIDLNLYDLLDIFNKKFYSGLKIDPSIETRVIGELVECITQIYNRESVKEHV